jgi:hypothetical protein
MAIGKSTANAYDLTREAIGPESVALIELMKLIASGNIKSLPTSLSEVIQALY